MSEATPNPLLPFAPIFSSEQYHEAAKLMDGWRSTYLPALFVLTLDSKSLLATVQDDEGAEAMLDLLEAITEFQKWRKLDDDMIASASARLLTVLSEKAGMTAELYQAAA